MMKRNTKHVVEPHGGMLIYLTMLLRFCRRYFLTILIAATLLSSAGCQRKFDAGFKLWKPKEKLDVSEVTDAADADKNLVDEPLRENEMATYMSQIRNRNMPDEPERKKGDWLFFSNSKSRQINRNMGG